MTTRWTQPQTPRLVERLREVATQLREAAPHLVDTQTRAFRGMVTAVQRAGRANDGRRTNG